MFTNRIIRHARVAATAIVVAALSGAVVRAQAPPPELPAGRPITLEQALAVAEPRSEAVAGAQAGIRRAEGEEIRVRSTLFPQLSGSLGYDRSLASEFDGLFNQTNQDDDATDDGFDDLPFGRANTWRATLQFSQNIWSGGRLSAARAVARAARDTATLTLTTAQAQVMYEVTQAYYDAALTDRLVAIAEASLEQAGATLRQTQAGFDAGTQPEFEVLRARVSRDNQTPVLIRQRVARDVALLRLKQMLDLPADFDLQLADALTDETLPPAPVFAPRVAGIESAMRTADWASFTRDAGAALPERAVVTEAATTVRLREASLKLVEAEKEPRVVFNSAYSRIAYPTNGLPTFDRSNWTIGANVTVPILTGGRQRGDELVARAELDQASVQRRQVEELAALDTRSAWAELMAAKASWEASSGTVQQAARAYQIADVRYSAGVSTQLELSDSRLLLQQAEANRAQAARDLQVARAKVALLPNLPLSPAAGAGTAAPAVPRTVPVPQTPTPAQDSNQFRNAGNPNTSATGTR